MKICVAHTRTHGKYEKYAAVLHLRNKKTCTVFLSSYRNTFLNQSARVFDLGYFESSIVFA